MKVSYSTDIKRVAILLYGKSKLGKTPLAATAPKPIFLDVEDKMVNVKGKVARVETKTIKQAKKAVKWLKKEDPEAKKYGTVVVDSLSELAENRYTQLKEKEKKEKKSGEKVNSFEKFDLPFDEIMDLIADLKELPHNIICICKTKPTEVDGDEKYRPLFPGKQLSPAIPYKFDVVLALIAYEDEDDEDLPMHERGKVLLTKQSDNWEAGSPDSLKRLECFDMSKIIKKVLK